MAVFMRISFNNLQLTSDLFTVCARAAKRRKRQREREDEAENKRPRAQTAPETPSIFRRFISRLATPLRARAQQDLSLPSMTKRCPAIPHLHLSMYAFSTS